MQVVERMKIFLVNMKPIYIFSLALITLSCSNAIMEDLDTNLSNDEEYEKIIMVMPPCDVDNGIQTKNEAIIGSSSIQYVWSADDVVGIFPNAGSQIYFSMASGAGQKDAQFDGGGWALRKNAKYYSYFPFIADYYIDKTAIPMSLIGQKQNGNADPGHAYLGNYCYMVAEGTSDEESGNLYFNYKRLAILFRITIPVDAGTYTELKARVDEKIMIQSGTFNAVNIDQKINNPVYTDNISIKLENLTMTESGQLVVFMMLAPFDLSNKQFTFDLKKADGTVCTSSIPGSNYTVGKTYPRQPNINVYPTTIEVGGAGEVTEFKIITSDPSVLYSLEKDVDWLTLGMNPVNGSNTISVTASKNPGGRRIGHITVSETVNGVLLKNVVTVKQYADGLTVEPGEWEDSGEDYGGSAH